MKPGYLPGIMQKATAVIVLLTCLVFLGLHVSVDWKSLTASIKSRLVTSLLRQHANGAKVLSRLNSTQEIKKVKLKVILLWTGFFGRKNWYITAVETIPFQPCPEQGCIVSSNKSRLNDSDAVVFHIRDMPGLKSMPSFRRPSQRWVFSSWESPPHSIPGRIKTFDYMFNWTMTYSLDSDVVAPYGKIVQQPNVVKLPDYAEGKSKFILMFVSNCGSRRRLKYANDLKKYVPVDIYGACGSPDPCGRKNECIKNLYKKYKFYLAFENSRCRYYITEKFWKSMTNEIVPVVMGPTIENYKEVAPPDSFIHVDNFTSVAELAKYLKILNQDNDAYNSYHNWRLKYSLYESKDHDGFMCDLCSKLQHSDSTTKVYQISNYWGIRGNCW